MKATTRAKLIIVWDTLTIWFVVPILIALCLLGMFASLFGLHRLDNWCAKQIEKIIQQLNFMNPEELHNLFSRVTLLEAALAEQQAALDKLATEAKRCRRAIAILLPPPAPEPKASREEARLRLAKEREALCIRFQKLTTEDGYSLNQAAEALGKSASWFSGHSSMYQRWLRDGLAGLTPK